MSECGTPDGYEVRGGGGSGHTGGEEGDAPTEALPAWTSYCNLGGTVPTGTNGTDTEDWSD
jgi:hypothetical protein